MTNPETQNTTPAKGISTRRSLLTKLWVLLGIVALAEIISLEMGKRQIVLRMPAHARTMDHDRY